MCFWVEVDGDQGLCWVPSCLAAILGVPLSGLGTLRQYGGPEWAGWPQRRESAVSRVVGLPLDSHLEMEVAPDWILLFTCQHLPKASAGITRVLLCAACYVRPDGR